MIRFLAALTAIFILAACASGPTCGKIICTGQENAAARHAANGGDTNFIPGTLLSPGYDNRYRRPSRIIEGITPAQVRDQLIARCIEGGYQITTADPHNILCERNAGVLAAALLQAGAGPPPRMQFHAAAYPHTQDPNRTVVVAWLNLQAYSFTGQPNMSGGTMSPAQHAEVQAILDGIRAPAQ